MSRECPKPKDWSRVKCKKCFQYGHGEKRCTESAGGSGDNGGYANQGGADGGWGSVPDDGGVANLDDWDEVAAICTDAYRQVAPKTLIAALDAAR